MVNHCPPQPMVIIIGDYRDPIQAFLVCEKKVLFEVPTKDIPVSLLMPYYISTCATQRDAISFILLLK